MPTLPTSRRPRSGLLSVALALGLTACAGTGDDELTPLPIGEGCQPLLAGAAGGECFLPFPSDHYLVDEPSLPSGKSVVFEGDARPATWDDFSADITRWRPADGFSRLPPIVVTFGEAVSHEGLTGIGDDYDRTLSAQSATVIIEADTGRFIPHFADVDDTALETPDRLALILRPQELLRPETRYVVALQGVLSSSGSPLAAPEGFRRLRDQQTAQDPALEAAAPRFEDDVFAVLEAAGVDRASLQLAWDFTTGSEEWAQQDMLDVRAQTLAWLEDHPPLIEVGGVFEDEQPEVWRTILGTLTVPLFLEHAGPGASLFRNAEGKVVQNGEVVVSFSATIPASVRDRFAPGFPLLYGHGFFGERKEIEYGKQRRLLDHIGAVAFSVDWWGMSESDIGTVVSSLGAEAWRSMQFSERVPQAMANFIALTFAIDQGLLDVEAFRRPSEAGALGVVADPAGGGDNAGALVFDADEGPHYLGISQGHILGGVLCALNPYLQRAVLQVGGAGLSHMMTRSSTFQQFLDVLELAVRDPLDKQAMIAQLQTHLDRIDPATWAPYLAGAPLPGEEAAHVPPVLMQIAVADASVPNFASLLHARQLGLPHVGPPPLELWHVEEVASGHATSGLALFGTGLDDSHYLVNAPADESPAHEHIRQQPPVQDQMQTWLLEGRIDHPCDGPCVLPVP